MSLAYRPGASGGDLRPRSGDECQFKGNTDGATAHQRARISSVGVRPVRGRVDLLLFDPLEFWLLDFDYNPKLSEKNNINFHLASVVYPH